MMERITIGQLYPQPITPLRKQNPHTPIQRNNENRSFSEVLQNNMVRISRHAEQRLELRGITLNTDQLAQIRSAVDKAEEKGARDTLMLMDGIALIVNIKNKTVVTAMDAASTTQSVFTQIDSAVIISS